ncbi:hypothetical protein MKX01_011503 [Papaver californicum]|nr:hypothetical protein MKX01_011503 [Papaver californicum]
MGDIVEGEAVFGSGTEVNLDSQVHWWHDKYHPRKPKYFNRVHTGYEWNKYNQNHYDLDNPLRKIVQGYKFSIFYPDLIDQSTTPTYTIGQLEGGNGKTCLIRFHAGPPYEDDNKFSHCPSVLLILLELLTSRGKLLICVQCYYKNLRLLTKSGSTLYSQRKGFKCTFEWRILHVYFNFSRYRYRKCI